MKSKYADEENSFKGRWTKEEHRKFLIALFLFGKDWTRVQTYVQTRSSEQIRSHAQKYFDQIANKGGSVIIKEHKISNENVSRAIQNIKQFDEMEDNTGNNLTL